MTRPVSPWNRRHSAIVSLLMALLLGMSAETSQSAQAQQVYTPLVSAQPRLVAAPPSGLKLTALDSTIRANWIPSTDATVAWQVLSAWDGATLVGSKVLPKTATAADQNGLQTGRTYRIRIQSVNQTGGLSLPVEASIATIAQRPFVNSAFFENFNATHAGDLDYNYFDVRSFTGFAAPESLGDLTDTRQVFAGERHFHTQVIASRGRMGLYIRPRVPFDIAAGRTGTLQFEVDLAPAQRIEGKWFEVHLVGENSLPGTTDDFGVGTGAEFPNSIEFSLRDFDDTKGAAGLNLPLITVNTAGQVREFKGTPTAPQTSQFTPVNVRVPVVIQLSQSAARMYINGKLVASASGFRLPFTCGYWIFAHRNFYSARYNQSTPRPPTLALQLMHWETIQFNGPQGSYNPVVKTYLQQGCSGITYNIHNGVRGCPQVSLSDRHRSQSFDFAVTSATLVRSAKLLFNGGYGKTLMVNVNGHPTTIVTKDAYFDALNVVDIPASWLKDGTRVTLGSLPGDGADITQLQLEVVYNTARGALPNPSVDFSMPMLSVTTNNFRIDHTNGSGSMPGDPMIHAFSTYVYNQGPTTAAPFAATIVTPDTPWLKIVSGAKGTVTPLVKGGKVDAGRINFQIDFSQIAPQDNRDDGEVAVVKISGGMMPVYIGILAVNDGATPHPVFIQSFPTITTFNRAAIPGY